MGECNNCKWGLGGLFLPEHLEGGIEVVGIEDTDSS